MAGRARGTGRPRASRRSSTSTGSRSSPSCGTGCSSPSSRTTTAASSRISELRLQYEDGAFLVRYHDTVLPIDPATYPQILTCRLPGLEASAGSRRPARARAPGRRRPPPPGCRAGRRPNPSARPRASRDTELVTAPAGRARARVPGREGVRRRDPLAVQRHPRPAGQLRPARRLAERPGVSRRLLGGRRRRDQLPAVLRRQRPGRHPDGGARRLRGGARAPAGPGPRGPHHRIPDRPPGRPLQPRALSRPSSGSGARASGPMGARPRRPRRPSTWWSRRC